MGDGDTYSGYGGARCKVHEILKATNAENNLKEDGWGPAALNIVNGSRNDIRWECSASNITGKINSSKPTIKTPQIGLSSQMSSKRSSNRSTNMENSVDISRKYSKSDEKKPLYAQNLNETNPLNKKKSSNGNPSAKKQETKTIPASQVYLQPPRVYTPQTTISQAYSGTRTTVFDQSYGGRNGGPSNSFTRMYGGTYR